MVSNYKKKDVIFSHGRMHGDKYHDLFLLTLGLNQNSEILRISELPRQTVNRNKKKIREALHKCIAPTNYLFEEAARVNSDIAYPIEKVTRIFEIWDNNAQYQSAKIEDLHYCMTQCPRVPNPRKYVADILRIQIVGIESVQLSFPYVFDVPNFTENIVKKRNCKYCPCRKHKEDFMKVLSAFPDIYNTIQFYISDNRFKLSGDEISRRLELKQHYSLVLNGVLLRDIVYKRQERGRGMGLNEEQIAYLCLKRFDFMVVYLYEWLHFELEKLEKSGL